MDTHVKKCTEYTLTRVSVLDNINIF